MALFFFFWKKMGPLLLFPFMVLLSAFGQCPEPSFELPLRRRSDEEVLGRYNPSETFSEKLLRLAKVGKALEVGGPTAFMKGLYELPWISYDVANLETATQTDQFASLRAPNGAPIRNGAKFYVDSVEKGQLFAVEDGSQLPLEDDAVDVLLAFHTLEHFRNPIKALTEWKRVLRKKGSLVIIVPYAPNTYDHNVPPSTIYDLILDANDNDLNNLEVRSRSYATLVNKSRGYPCDEDTRMDTSFAAAALDAPCHHWHVYNFALLEDAMACLGLTISHLAILDNWHQFLIADNNQ